jgi:hypothetical protein
MNRQIQQEGTEVTEKRSETLFPLLAPVKKYLRPMFETAVRANQTAKFNRRARR